MPNEEHQPKEQFVEVTVVTTSGAWPASGADRVPAHQKVKVQLDKAARGMKITNTDGWIATIASREIDVD